MHTGNLISDLTAMVDRAEQRAQEIVMEQELHAIYAMQIPVIEGDNIFMGAA
jgi:hypothetical protein